MNADKGGSKHNFITLKSNQIKIKILDTTTGKVKQTTMLQWKGRNENHFQHGKGQNE